MSIPWWLAEHDPGTVLSVLRQFDWAIEFEVDGAAASVAEALIRNGYVSALIDERKSDPDGSMRLRITSGGLMDLGRALQERCIDPKV